MINDVLSSSASIAQASNKTVVQKPIATGGSNPAASGKPVPAEVAQLPQQGNAKKVDKSNLEDAIVKINNYVQTVQRDLSFSIDDDSGKTVIKVMDASSGDLIRQIPTEDVIAIAGIFEEAGHEESFGSDEAQRGLIFSEST